jgi:AMMECR1 domain-containing protein
LDPQRFGIEIADELGRRAVLLPRIEGVDTVERQLALTRRKAGIPADAPIRIRRFEATRV